MIHSCLSSFLLPEVNKCVCIFSGVLVLSECFIQAAYMEKLLNHFNLS